MNAIIINISAKHNKTGVTNELLKMLTDLFDERIEGKEKVGLLENNYGLSLTTEVREEVEIMCTYGASIAKKNIELGISQGLKALVSSLKKYY